MNVHKKCAVHSDKRPRIVSVYKDRYLLLVNGQYVSGEITGNLRYSAQSAEDFPTTGDYVDITYMSEDEAIILSVFPRKTLLMRQNVSAKSEKQLIAANIDMALVAMAVTEDFNLNRLERYITICSGAGIDVMCVLTKTDLSDTRHVASLIADIRNSHPMIRVITTSMDDFESIRMLESVLETGKTYCLIGSSGTGKSTLLNALIGNGVQKTSEISVFNKKGRHTTTSRDLFELACGAYVIDTPGMKLIGMVDTEKDITEGFDNVQFWAGQCRYKDCTHTQESGCAVLKAVDDGQLSEREYHNYIRLRNEQAHYNASFVDKKRKGKKLSMTIKHMKKSGYKQ